MQQLPAPGRERELGEPMLRGQSRGQEDRREQHGRGKITGAGV
jgi:hypothetical protein